MAISVVLGGGDRVDGVGVVGDEVMGEGLYWKCREELILRHPREFILGLPYLHCHYEPKEEPVCWCKRRVIRPSAQRDFSYRLISVEYPRSDEIVKLKYCPECGNVVRKEE